MSGNTNSNYLERAIAPTIDPLLRLPHVLKIVPIGRSTWWQWVRDGKAPKPVKLGDKTTAWRSSDIQKFVDGLSVGE